MERRPVGRLRIGMDGPDGREIPRHVLVFGRISPLPETPHGASLHWGDLLEKVSPGFSGEHPLRRRFV